ncbi:MAG: hypothetical protein WC840_07645 [Candidatus Peribacteraceae bacterium]
MKSVNKAAAAVLFAVLFAAAGCGGSGGSGGNPGGGTISTDATANKNLITSFTGANSVTVSGTWTNNTFGTSGNVDANISFNTATNILTFVFNIDGNVYGHGDPAPETFTVDLTDFINNGTMTAHATSATYGDVSITLTYHTDGTGTITGTATNEPTGQVTNAAFSGTFALSGGSVTFSIDSATFTFNGVNVTCSNSVTATIN